MKERLTNRGGDGSNDADAHRGRGGRGRRTARLLVVEDDPELATGLRDNLEIEGYAVSVAEDGSVGLAEAQRTAPDLVILDLMLPGIDGFRVLRLLRESGYRAPVLVLTARGQESDKVRALRLGADDYVTKPFGVLELLARVEALLRRASLSPDSDRELHLFGDIALDADARTVQRGGVTISLAPLEFDLLLALARRRSTVVTRRQLLDEVWGYDSRVLSRTVDAHVTALRRKLEANPASPRHIVTARKVGYRLDP